MLTQEQRQAFDEQGFVRVKGALSQDEALAMEARIWVALEQKYGARRTEKATWTLITFGASFRD